MIMSIYLAHRRPFRRAGRALLLAVGLFAACIIGFGLSRSFELSLVLLGVSGMADNVSVVIRSTLLQVLTPEHLFGRVSSVNAIFIGSSNELGAFESGVAAKLLGTVTSVILGGVAAQAFGGFARSRRGRHRRDELPVCCANPAVGAAEMDNFGFLVSKLRTLTPQNCVSSKHLPTLLHRSNVSFSGGPALHARADDPESPGSESRDRFAYRPHQRQRQLERRVP
jgi:MFS family permease